MSEQPAPKGVYLDFDVVRLLGPRELPAAMLYAWIVDADPAGGWVPLTVAKVTEATGMGRGQGRRALDILVEVGLLEKAIGAGLGRASYSYRVRRTAAAA